MPNQSNFSDPVLLPADIDNILEKFSELLESHKNLSEQNSIYAKFKQNHKKLDVLFPLKEHPIHGITGLHAVEKYDSKGFVKEYHYQWKRIIPKEGIAYAHISAWENEPHNAPNTPEQFIVKTEPHHHHHIPGDRKQRTENYRIRNLESVFNFIAQYINTGEAYIPNSKSLRT